MRLITPILLFLALFITQASAQDSTLIISQPVDISNEGINRVLQLSNGNTALLHFENKRHLRVKLFDKTGKEIASAVPELKTVDVTKLEDAKLENLFEADGDIVLFLNQKVNYISTLTRVILDAKTGRIKQEEIVTGPDKAQTHVFDTKNVEGYTIVFDGGSSAKDSLSITVKRYDDKHNLKEELKYSYKNAKERFYTIHASSNDDGDVLLGLASGFREGVGFADIQFIYLRNDMHSFITRTFTFPQGYILHHMLFTRNVFAGNLNVVLLSGGGLIIDINTRTNYLMNKEHNWLIMPEDMSDIKVVDFSAVAKYNTIQNADAANSLSGFNTNTNGITTILHVDYSPANKFDGSNWESQRKINVSKYDDNGKQIGIAVDIPSKHGYSFDKTKGLLYSMADNKTLSQFSPILTSKNVFVIMNDIPANQDVKEQSAVTEVTDFNNSEAVICQVNKKNIYTRKYFFNTVDSGEHKQVLPATLNYDKKTKMVAAVMRKKKGKQETFHMAWRWLED